MNLLVFGAPGSGVSTLSERLSDTLNLPCIALHTNQTPPDAGDPIPIPKEEYTELINQINAKKGYLIDGSPCLLNWELGKLDGIIYLMTPKLQRLQRLREREIASQGIDILKEGCREFKVFNRYMYWVSQFDQAGIDRESKILHQKLLNSLSIPIFKANGLLGEEELTQQALEWINELTCY